MKIKYKAAFWTDQERYDLLIKLKSLGFNLRLNEFEVVEFYEDSENRDYLESLFTESDILLTKSSVFTKKEKDNSDFLGVVPNWHYGYPQPEDSYLEKNYNLKDYCYDCGIGKKQIKPFRLMNEPKWGRNHIFQLNWIFDEYLIKAQLIKEISQEFNLKYKNVIKHKTDEKLETVVQLEIPELDVKLALVDYDFVVCQTCKRKKYLPISWGRYPPFLSSQKLHLFKSKENFGSGANAFNLIYISKSLYNHITTNKLKGIDFIPVAERKMLSKT